MKKTAKIFSAIAVLLLFLTSCGKNTAYKALIITGQNTSNWEVTSPLLKKILDNTGLFSATIVKAPAKGSDMNSFNPAFDRYNVVVLDYNGDEWSEKTKNAFTEYVKNGGGVVIFQSSGNAFPGWKDYNEMCGMGGWEGKLLTEGSKAHEFEIRTRNSENPITKGLPVRWIHASDLLQCRMSGPSKNMEVLATAFCDTTGGGTGKDEPVLMAITYGKGRIFHTTLGYSEKEEDSSMKCSGFITTLQRGAEWAATGNVTQQVPLDFPSAAAVVIRPELNPLTLDEDFAGLANYQIDKSTRYLTDIQARIRNLSGNLDELLKIEKMMVDLLKNAKATDESKKLILRELSWMGSDYCIPAVKEMAGKPEIKDYAEFALERLKAR